MDHAEVAPDQDNATLAKLLEDWGCVHNGLQVIHISSRD